MNLTENVKYILNTLHKNGFEAYVVGGAVRDSLMNKKPKDLDVTTNATPLEIKKCFDKTVDTGIEHGTVTVVINKENIEVTTYRIDGEYINNRKPKEVLFTKSLYEDLVRRDFTINAIAYNETDGYVDKFNGEKDITLKIIRAVGEKEQRFIEDSLRIYRGIRFASQLGFTIEDETYSAMKNQKHLTKNLSVERIRDEFNKSLLGKYPQNLKFYKDLDLLKFYDENFSKYFNDNIKFIIELLEKNISNKNIEHREILNAICLINFDVNDVENFLKNFREKNSVIKQVKNILICLSQLKNINFNEFTDFEARKFLSKFNTEFEKALYIYSLYNDIFDAFKILENNKQYPVNVKDLWVNGKDLMEIGINGKEIGDALSFLLNQVLSNPSLNDKEILIELLQNRSKK